MVEGALLHGRYRLEEVIGEGGMAGVWRAYDRILERAVAVKILRPQYAADPVVVNHFRREARHAASVVHPNVASVFDYSVDDGTVYIVMQLIEGPDLDTVLRRHGRLPVGHGLRIGASVADALQAAHDQRLVHRDIKPGNILLDEKGEVKVVDFGIARALGESRTTNQGTLLASVRYCSPEQVGGDPVGPASDIYSLGLVLHESLTGRPAFLGTTPAAVALARLRDIPPPPSKLASDLPDNLDPVVMRALAREPAERYSSAREFGEAIRRWSRESQGREIPVGVGLTEIAGADVSAHVGDSAIAPSA